MAESVRVAVIMAGGSGERFWPLSREGRPKQLLPLTGSGKSLVQEAIERIEPLIPRERLYVATGESLRDVMAGQNKILPPERILAEPAKRNTAGALIWAASSLLAEYPGQPVVLAVLTADHDIKEASRFREVVDTALLAAEQHDALVTIGIRPTRPETGYGYIEVDRDGDLRESSGNIPVFPVHRFHEKPNQERAGEYMASGDHLWNSGMFFWRISTFFEELDKADPEMAASARRIASALKNGQNSEAAAEFSKLENVSIDFALLERAEKVLVVPGDFPWDDVGAWDALDRLQQGDENRNVIVGKPVVIDSEGCIVCQHAEGSDQAVGVVGLQDVIVVTTEDCVLVVSKSHAQDVRKVVRELRERGSRRI